MKRLLCAAVLAACAGSALAADKGADELHQSMTKGAQEMQSMPMEGELDHDFVQAMLMHHRQALEMSRIELRDGKDAKAKAFANKFITAQSKEIKELERWILNHEAGENK